MYSELEKERRETFLCFETIFASIREKFVMIYFHIAGFMCAWRDSKAPCRVLSINIRVSMGFEHFS